MKKSKKHNVSSNFEISLTGDRRIVSFKDLFSSIREQLDSLDKLNGEMQMKYEIISHKVNANYLNALTSLNNTYSNYLHELENFCKSN